MYPYGYADAPTPTTTPDLAEMQRQKRVDLQKKVEIVLFSAMALVVVVGLYFILRPADSE